jgi:hypothetical protein
MANKKIMWRILGAALVFGFLAAGCPTTPPVRPDGSLGIYCLDKELSVKEIKPGEQKEAA